MSRAFAAGLLVGAAGTTALLFGVWQWKKARITTYWARQVEQKEYEALQLELSQCSQGRVFRPVEIVAGAPPV